MKTATLRRAVLAATAAATTLLGGCDNRHLIGEFDGGGPMFPEDGAINVPDVAPDRPDGRPFIGDDASQDGAVPNQDGAVPNQDGAVPNQDGALLGPVQSWTGYIENYMFNSGSDAVRLSFASDSAGNLVGTVTLGNGTPPPPATDPNVGYPADFHGGIPPAFYFAEGFGYSIRAGTLVGGRLRFGVGTWELWTGWCALLTPVPPKGDCDEVICQGSCLPNWGSMSDANGCALANPATGQYEPVDCGKLALCGISSVCTCYESGCTVHDAGTAISFDVAVTANLASGSVTGRLGDHNVHFTKDP